ncbi:DUF1298 domain-containing protein [Rhodococcus hoagii]|nr:DUF1298 domain-containing protein [Prescottella equi]
MAGRQAALRGMSRAQVIALSALGSAPLAPQTCSSVDTARCGPPFNIVISNVHGPERPLYLKRMPPRRPLSPVTARSTDRQLNTPAPAHRQRDRVRANRLSPCRPRLEAILDHLDSELAALEVAVGICTTHAPGLNPGDQSSHRWRNPLATWYCERTPSIPDMTLGMS